MSKMLGEGVAIVLNRAASIPGDTQSPESDGLGAVAGQNAERLAELFTPEIVLPEQFFEGALRSSYISGEKALMLAVLEDGIRCFQEHWRNPRSNPRLLSQQAEEWLRGVDYEWPFSFVNVCESLGVNPEALRGALLAWKAKRLAESEVHGGCPTPTEKKVYRLHLRTRRTSGIR